MNTVDLPEIPGGTLAPPGHTLSTEEAVDRLVERSRISPASAHVDLDNLLLGALAVIRDGHPDPVGVATGVLTVADALWTGVAFVTTTCTCPTPGPGGGGQRDPNCPVHGFEPAVTS